MIARGMHIETVNETLSIRKSGQEPLIDVDAPRASAAGSTLPHEVSVALTRGAYRSIDDAMEEMQRR